MSNQCYHNGDFWQCDTATTAGESPTTTPASWRKIKLPSKWRWVLARLTYAGLLELDGQTDKANAARSVAYGREGVGLDDLVRQEANEEERCNRRYQRGGPARAGTGATRPVKASVILDDAYRLIGWDADQLDNREKADARDCLSLAVQEVWERWWWQELMVCEQMPLETSFVSGHAYLAGERAYSEYADWFYQCVATTLAEPTDEDLGAEVFWARWSETAAELWEEDRVYDPGDRVTWLGQEWQRSDAAAGTEVPGDDSTWWSVTAWQPILPFTDYNGDTHGPFGPIRSVSQYDPRKVANPVYFELDVTEDGTRVVGLTVGRVWVWSRRVTPILTGDDFSSTATYEATDTEDLVYDS